MDTRVFPAIVLALALAVAGACTKQPAAAPAGVSVDSIEIGRSLNADKSIDDNTDSFRPADTIYASVATAGSGTATLSAAWTFQDAQPVDTGSQTIAPNGPARTEFHISKPDGWPQGRYRLDVTLNGSPAGSKQFDVK
jgi:hypothetical protein